MNKERETETQERRCITLDFVGTIETPLRILQWCYGDKILPSLTLAGVQKLTYIDVN